MSRRVLFLTQTHNVWGGMEQWLHNFTFWLQANTDWDVHVGVARGASYNDARAYIAAHPHMRPWVLDVRAGTESSRISAISRAIGRLDPGLVVPVASGAVFPAVRESKSRGRRVRLVVPVRSQHPDLFVNIADNFGIVDGVVVVNRLMQRWFAEHLGAQSPARIHYIRHGVKPATQLHVPDPSRPLRVALIGRLEPAIKRVLDVIPMVRELERLQTAFELHVYGDGPSESELRVALEGNGVFFHGYATQERLYAEAYPAIDAVLLFSTEEGTPNVICEAMQHAVVPVTSRYRGQAGEGFVIDGVTGLTFPVGDATTAAQRIHALAGDRELLGRLSHAAHEVVRGDSDTRMHRDWLTVFETTLALPPRNEPPAAVRVASSAGRLDRIAGPSIADRLRVVLRGGAKHPDGWSEWPGTMPVARERAEKVVCELEEIDRAQR